MITNNIQSDTSKVTNCNPIIKYLSIWNPYNGKKFDSSITKKRTETFMLSYSSASTILIGGQSLFTGAFLRKHILSSECHFFLKRFPQTVRIINHPHMKFCTFFVQIFEIKIPAKNVLTNYLHACSCTFYLIAMINFAQHHSLPALQIDSFNSWSTWFSARSQV